MNWILKQIKKSVDYVNTWPKWKKDAIVIGNDCHTEVISHDIETGDFFSIVKTGDNKPKIVKVSSISYLIEKSLEKDV